MLGKLPGRVQAHQSALSSLDFVYGIFGSLLLLFNSFAINMWLQYRRIGRWRDYAFGEAVYLALSLVAKGLLAWQICASTLVA